MIRKFNDYVDRRSREAKEHLKIVKAVLEKHGMEVASHLDAEDPYLFVKDGDRHCSFDGVRLYVSEADTMAFRVQKEADTHPYGKAYALDVEGMYLDLIADKCDEDKAGVQVAKGIVRSIKKFFEKSGEAERDIRAAELDGSGDPMGKVLIKGTGTDYSNMIFTKSGN